MSRLEWKENCNSTPKKIISYIRAKKLVEKGCWAFLAHLRNTSVEIPPIRLVPVVCNLPGMPSDRDIDFVIDLEPSTSPISILSYRMVLAELRKLKIQLQNLLSKRFIHSSVSPWGTPIQNKYVY